MKKIVIIGGGFGGINLATGLAGKNDFHVTVVDRNNYNFFPPFEHFQVQNNLSLFSENEYKICCAFIGIVRNTSAHIKRMSLRILLYLKNLQPWEQPQALTEDLRAAFKSLR